MFYPGIYAGRNEENYKKKALSIEIQTWDLKLRTTHYNFGDIEVHVVFRYSGGGTEKNHQNASEYSTLRLRFDPDTCRIQDQNVTIVHLKSQYKYDRKWGQTFFLRLNHVQDATLSKLHAEYTKAAL